MRRLFVMLIMFLLCVTITAQKNADKIQATSKVIVKDGTIHLRAVQTDLNSKHAEAQKLMTGLLALIGSMPSEIKTADKNKAEEFLNTLNNYDQKVNQLLNIISTIIKTTKETENSIAQNIN